MERDWIGTSAPWIVRAVGSAVAVAWGRVDPIIWLLIATIMLDILSGLLAGGRAGEINSSISFRGMRKKAMTLLLVAFGALLESQVPVPLASLIAGAFIVNEGLSILENAGRLGLPIPVVLTEALAKLGPDSGRTERES